jgi:putative aldouronate transport system permease protein
MANEQAIETKLYKRQKSMVSKGQVFLVLFILLVVAICVLPMLNVVAISLSRKSDILAGRVTFWPVGFNLDAYKGIFQDKSMISCMFYTIGLTAGYTVLSMFMSILLAYPLSKKRLYGRKVLTLFVMVTMYFSGGTIPIYLTVKGYGLLDTVWCLVFPAMISTYNVIILKSSIAALPAELEQAAIIDGANDFQVLVRVTLPLCMATISTIALFYAVAKWNSFSDALYYITSKRLQPLQLRLYNIIKGSTSIELNMVEGNSAELSQNISESIESATIIFATLPILLVYPFVQRYFISGVTIGAVKG